GIKLLERPCIGVIITTDKVYQNHETGQAYKEEDRIGGYDPYSASKACAELVIDSFRKSFFNPKEYAKHGKSIASARAGNVIGGGDWAADRLIPDIVRAFSKGEPVQIRNPHAVRPWQHVLEPLTGYLLLGANMVENHTQFADAFNFGPYPEDVLTVKEMAEMAIEIWQNNKIEFSTLANQPHEAGLLSLSIEKANRELQWFPRWNAQEALQNTIEWYKTFYTREQEAVQLLKKQFNNYFNIHQ
ncbi:MAG: CDP-glucose 4,6-dehydratase, partial [Bacteroidales bacterium]|nr:CDP-glucose 4,6-dehydratase [Bacteroidales bacterium]